MVPYLRVANVLDGYIDYSDVYRMHFSAADQKKYTLRKDDILLNEGQSTELVGRSAIYEGPEDQYCYQNSLVNFRTGPLVNPRFARATFKRWLDIGHFTLIVKQTTSMAHLGGQRFANLEFPVPPIAEQAQIGAVLDALDESIRKTEQIIAKLKQVKQGLLHDLLTRGIDDNGELRDPERHPEQFKDSPLGRIPKGWEMLRASELCSKITKGTTPEATAMWQGGDGIRFLRVDNLLFDGRLDLEASDFRVSWPTHVGALARSRVFPGDVLTNIVGPPLGKIGLVTPEIGEVNINQAIALLRPTARISSEFLVTWLAGVPAQSWLRRQAKQTSGQLNLTLAMCNALPVPMMSASEQLLIAERMMTVEHSLRAERSSAEKLRLLKTGMMEDLLTGRVRVTPLLEQPAP